MWPFNKVDLPRTEHEFDLLVEKVVKKYSLTDKHHASGIVSVAIQHLPNHQGYTTLDYLGGWVLKNLAYNVAKYKGNKLQHEAQISQLEELLTREPNNQQAMDGLTKAAQEGSTFAKEALERLFPQDPMITNVTPIKA